MVETRKGQELLSKKNPSEIYLPVTETVLYLDWNKLRSMGSEPRKHP